MNLCSQGFQALVRAFFFGLGQTAQPQFWPGFDAADVRCLSVCSAVTGACPAQGRQAFGECLFYQAVLLR